MKRNHYHLVIHVLFLMVAMAICVSAQTTKEFALETGKPVEQTIKGGEAHSYRFTLRRGEFLRAVGTSAGIDVVATLYGPGGEKLLMSDLLKYPGPEPLSFLTEREGAYLLEVNATGAASLSGRYALMSETRGSATEDDKARVAAETVLREAAAAERGGAKDSLGRALDLYAEGARRWRALGDKFWEAFALHYSGRTSDSLGEKQKALEFYNQALSLRRAIGDREGEASTLNNIGLVYNSLGERQKALEFYDQALPISSVVGDRGGEARTLNNIANVYNALGEKQKALEFYNQALPIFKAVGNRGSEAGALGNIGNIHTALGEKQKALEFYNQALPIFKAVGDRSGEANTLNNIANIYSDLGEKQKAFEFYIQALHIYKAVGDRRGEAGTLHNIGNVHSALGEKQKALECYSQALPIFKAVGNRSGEAITLNNIGIVYLDLGETQKALEFYNQALPIRKAVGDRGGEADTLIGIGNVYNSLGEKQKALEFYNHALPILKAVGDRGGEADTLNNIGVVYLDLGEKQKAFEFYIQALHIYKAVGDRSGEAGTLNNIGNAHKALGETQKALEFYNQALPIHKAIPDRGSEANTLNNIGIVYIARGEMQKALACFNQALPIHKAVGNRGGEALTLVNLMLLARDTNTPALAIFYGKQAINTYQQLRSNIQGLDEEIQKTYLQTVALRYRQLADLLITQNRLPEAQQVLAMLKDEEYFDFVRRDAGEANSLTARATLNSEENALQAEYNKLADEVTRIGRERGDLFTKKARTPEEEQQLAGLEEQLSVATDHFQKFLEQLQVKLGVRSEQGARVSEVQDALGMQKTLRELGDGAVLLYTLVGADKYRIMLVTPDTQQAYENPLSAADLARKVLAFREALQDPNSDPAPRARELYNIVIGPKLARDLKKARAQTVMWSLDGVLRYVPVAALQDETGKYLVETYRNVIFTPATRDRLKDAVAPNWKALGFGVSQSAEVELNGKTYTTKPLPGVTQELHSIIGEETNTSSSALLRGRVLLDEVFTKQTMREALRQRYELVHIASHFMFQPGNETDSFLLLGGAKDNKLTIAEIKRLSFEGVDLLTLSACETAMSGAKANGVEVESFGVLAQRQGAEAVMATLWPVADESTPLLMREFYRIREKEGLPKAEALRRAQLAVLKGTINPDRTGSAPRGLVRLKSENQKTSSSQTAYAHPFYWAPFILVGNWK